MFINDERLLKMNEFDMDILLNNANLALKETLIRLGNSAFGVFLDYVRIKDAKILRNLGRANLLSVVHELKGTGKVLVTSYINPVLAEELIKEGIEFYDCCGNTYLKSEHGVFCYIGASQKTKTLITNDGIAFQSTGLKVVFTLLTKNFKKPSFRKIHEFCGASLGAIKKVVDDLVNQGFLYRDASSGKIDWRIRNREQLIDKWCEGYQQRLRKKLLVKRFTTEKKEWWKINPLQGIEAQWGGEVAAYLLEKAVTPEIKTIYQFGNINKVIAKNRLKEAEGGDVEVLEAFWEKEGKVDTVHPLLIYADLITSGDSRNLEAALIIKEKYLLKETDHGQ